MRSKTVLRGSPMRPPVRALGSPLVPRGLPVLPLRPLLWLLPVLWLLWLQIWRRMILFWLVLLRLRSPMEVRHAPWLAPVLSRLRPFCRMQMPLAGVVIWKCRLGAARCMPREGRHVLLLRLLRRVVELLGQAP